MKKLKASLLKWLIDWAILLGAAWTSILIIQTLEFPFHLDFLKYNSLFLPLYLFSSTVFILMGLPVLTAIFIVMGALGASIPIIRRFRFLLTLVLWLGILWLFQEWAIANAYLSVTVVYYSSLAILFLLFFCAAIPRKGRIILAVLAPAIMVILIGWRYANFTVLRWTSVGKGPNILLIVADTTRRDHTSMYGYERDTTPFLNSLAKEGMVFENAISSSAWTKPAMAGMLTSRYLEADGILIGPLPISWQGMRMPEFFYKVGYDTAILTANPNTGSYSEATRGYKWIIQTTPSG